MSKGSFINFEIDYMKNGNQVPPQQQADEILQKAEDLISGGALGVAITYSANYGQTRLIEETYFTGGWNTQTNGAHQATVIYTMETLLGTKYQNLQGKMRIAPITTMNAYTDLVDPWNDDVLMGIVVTDLERIKIYLEAGWNILGWQNQDTVTNPKHPYAIGGGVATLPAAVSDKIQNTLIGFAATYK
ncbi:hypothetical protein BH10ACI1_BH10ACI1_07440 [soil metagenome]